MQQQQQRAGGAHVDTMHGYGTAVHQDSQQQQEQKPLQPQQQAGVIAGAAAAAAADEATHGKASSQGAPPAAAGAATQRPKPRVVKGAVAEMQAAGGHQAVKYQRHTGDDQQHGAHMTVLLGML